MLNQKKNVTGSYSVSVYRIDWNKSKTEDVKDVKDPKIIKEVEKPKGIRLKIKKNETKEIVYPVFKSCSDKITDPYWKGIFDNASQNRFPIGYSYNGHNIVRKQGNKETTCEVYQDEVTDDNIAIYINFFKQSGLISVSDIDTITTENENFNYINLQWKDIRKEKTREIFIDEYIKNISIKMKMNKKAYIELYTCIQKAFLFGYLNKNDVILENGNIAKINGLYLNYDEKVYYIEPERLSRDKSNKCNKRKTNSDTSDASELSNNKKKSIMKNWFKLLASLNPHGRYGSTINDSNDE